MPKEKHSALTKALSPYDEQVKFSDDPLPLCPANMAIIGKKGCGKTTLLLNILMRKESPWFKHFDRIYIISPTAHKDPKVKELLDDVGHEQHWENLDEQTLQEVLDTIEAHIEEYQKKKKNKDKKPNSLLIIDDSIHQMVAKKQIRLLCRLVTQNRHIGLTTLFSVQKWNAFIPPVIRSNLDVIAFYRTDNKKELNSFVEEMPSDEDATLAMYRFATNEPYSFLLANFYGVRPRFFKRFDEIAYTPKNDDDE
jgi:Cdc6-like AAA superfamily ATPase